MDTAMGRKYASMKATTKPKLEYGGGTEEEKKDRSKKMQEGFLKQANDNPISKAAQWFSK